MKDPARHPRLLPRFFRRQTEADDRAKRDRIERDSVVVVPSPGASAPGDTRKLRGIPAIGRGVAGATPGSDPAREYERRDDERQRAGK